MADFATVGDITSMFRELTSDEIGKAQNLLPVVSDALRAKVDIDYGKDLDKMIEGKSMLSNIAKMIVAETVVNMLDSSGSSTQLTQESQSALGYTWTGTYAVPKGGIYFKDSYLKLLGLKKRQKIGVIEPYDYDPWDNSDAGSES